MVVEFEDNLDDGREIYFSANDFEDLASDGFHLSGCVRPRVFGANLFGTNFPVSLTPSEERRLLEIACDLFMQDAAQ